MISPVQAAGQGLAKAFLEIVKPSVPEPIIPLRFNPTEYQIQRANNFAEVPIPGLEAPPLQFVRGGGERLTAELLVDTSDTLEDVRIRYTDKLRLLMRVNSELHAPPIVRFAWDTQVFVGVMESLNTTFVLFTPEGIPLRARLSITLREYRPAEVQIKEMKTSSPDVEKSWTLRRGDTLSAIAYAAYKDVTRWRAIAVENGIRDPRRLEPGMVLTLPRLR
jgi:nucleoid-associated protein YgaU